MNCGHRVAQLSGGGFAGEGELPCVADLCGDVVTGFLLHASGEGMRMIECETAVEEIQRLDRRGAGAADGGALAGVGAIEGSEDGFRFTTDFVRVDHAALVPCRGCLNGCEAAQTAALVEEVVTAAIHRQIKRTADGEDGVAEGFRFKAAGGKAPE